jgi:hypothetical protein
MDVNWTSGHIEPSLLKAGSSFMHTETGKTYTLIERMAVLDPNGSGGMAGEGWVVAGQVPGSKTFLPDGTLRALSATGTVLAV